MLERLNRRSQFLLLVLAAVLIFGGGIQYAYRGEPRSETDLPQVVSQPGQAGKEGVTSSQETGAATPGAEVVVHVVGAVEKPGVYRLPAGSRVDNAVSLAVPVKEANPDALNLAAVLEDGQQVQVPKIGDPVPATSLSPPAGATPHNGKVNLNTASLAQLENLPGIGPALARRIIDYRTRKGPFRDPRDITNVSGIGEAKYQQIQNLISIN